jgi:hypothetical protein
MLAYVFWHWPRGAVAPADYEAKLRAFQKCLAENPPAGFLRSVVYRVRDASWLEPSSVAYEEWYLTDGSAALDPLNDAAVAPACRAAHDAAAHLAAGGTAGLYRLRLGAAELKEARCAYWLAKPAGMKYEDFYALFTPLVGPAGIALWGRQMTLGPTPEFCLHSREDFQLPPGIAPQKTLLERIWP